MLYISRLVLIGFLLTVVGCVGQGEQLVGPGGWLGGKFEVVEVDTRFTEHNGPTYQGKPNRISRKSVGGGVPLMDFFGVYVNPTIVKSRDEKKIHYLGLDVLHYTGYDTLWGELGDELGSLELITFLLNGDQTVVLPIINADVTNYFAPEPHFYDIVESGTASISIEEYREIIYADTVAVKIQGSEQSVTYEIDDISASFLPNLREFFNLHVES